MSFKCPICKEFLEYNLKKVGDLNRYLLYCILCNKYFVLNPGKELVEYEPSEIDNG